MAKHKLKLAVLISGTGRSLRNMIRHINEGRLAAEISVVISSVANISGLQYAEEDSIPIEIVERSQFGSLQEFSDANFDICRTLGVDYVVLAGYLRYLNIPKDFENRVLNIHPSLIPAFCGKGMYGDRVHAKVLEYGSKITGCTVHFVDQEYDNGPIILQKAVEVQERDTIHSLNDRVFAAECEAYPEAIELLAEKRISIKGRVVKIAPAKSEIDF